MSRQTELKRLKQMALESNGYVAKPCPVCSWWQLEAGNRELFEADYCQEIRCHCSTKGVEMKQVISVLRLSGKARDVFAQIAYLAQVAGNVTLQELVWSKGVIAK